MKDFLLQLFGWYELTESCLECAFAAVVAVFSYGFFNLYKSFKFQVE